jgi:DNA-binding beta-propeller fold protein YncE
MNAFMHLLRSAATFLALAALSATPLLAATPTTGHDFHIENRWTIGGNGGWGYLSLDPATHHLFIPRTDHISVLDTTTGKPLGEIDGMSNLRNVALDDSGKYGYATDVTDGTAGFVRVFDRSAYKLITSIPTGPIPYAIVFDPATKLVFAFSSRAHNVAVIDTATNQTVSTIPLDGRPGNAVGDGKGSVYVTLPAQGEIQRIDAASKKVMASWPISPCTGPNNLAIDVVQRQLFTTCEDHKLVAISANTGQVTAIGSAPENVGDLQFDSRTNMLFLADPTGLLTIFRRDSPAHYIRLQDVTTEPGARTLVVSHDDGKAYLVTAKFGANNSPNVSEELRYRPTPIPGTFSVLVVGRE